MVKSEKALRDNYPLIDVLKFTCAVVIIAIHTTPFINYTSSMLYIPYVYLKIFAVPFFFVASSSLFFCRIDHYDTSERSGYLKKWFTRLVTLYLLYSVINLTLSLPNIDINSFGLYLLYFIFLGKGNGYLWFFAALIEAVFILYTIRPYIKNALIVVYLLLLFPMLVLQFYYGFFVGTPINKLISIYDKLFDGVRNVVSGLYFCFLGMVVPRINKRYNKTINRTILAVSIIISWIEFRFSYSRSLLRNEYASFGISLTYIPLIVECMQLNITKWWSPFIRKCSNVMYLQHRYILIIFAIAYKYTDIQLFNNHIFVFGLTVCILMLLTFVYSRMEKTRLKTIVKHLY